MRLTKVLAGVLAGSALATAGLVALAGPAAAADFGPQLTGNIYMFPAAGGWTANAYSDVVTSGGGTTRPFQSATSDVQCPAGTTNVQLWVQIPQAGVPKTDWDATALTALSPAMDAEGRFYTGRGDTMSRATVMTWLSSQPGNRGTMPLELVCQGSNAGEVYGYFETTMTVSGTSSTDFAWSVPAPTAVKSATTTTLTASAAAVEAGDPVDLTATVAPAGATGTVEFLAGTTSLGIATVSAGVATLTTGAIPVGTNAVTAVYAGDTAYSASTSAAVTVEVAPVAPRATTTTASVDVTSGAAYSAVTVTCSVVAATGTPNGSVRILDGAVVLGSVPVTGGVVAPFTTNVLGAGDHSITCAFVGTAPYTDSVSAAVTATYTLAGAAADATVVVTVPVGTISITTPYSPAAPLDLGTAVLDPADSTYSASAPFGDIVITDTRAGNLGFTASVVSTPFVSGTGDSFGGEFAGLTGLAATQVVGNALQAGDVVLVDHAPFADGLAAPKVFATYAAGHAVGTAQIAGTFGIDQVPTSVTPGQYRATVTFTAV